MANIFQKSLFVLSTIAPIFICFAIVYYIQNKEIPISLIAAVVGIVLTIYDLMFIHLCKKNVEAITISLDSVSPDDKWAIGYIISYLLPFASIVVKDFNPIFSLVIGVIICIVLSIANSIVPNPLLMICGYHFFRVSTVDGVADYCLICKRNTINNKSIVKKARCVFGYFLIEKEV